MEKLNLAALPTPISKMESLSKELNKNIWIKRDDLTGIEFSGNKVRKLEYIFKEVIDTGCDYVFTCGGKQSNHARATAAAAAKLGVKCVLYLRGEDDGKNEGNVFLDKLFGAEIKFCTGMTTPEIAVKMEEDKAEMAKNGKKAYVLPLGGSTPLGAYGYIDCYKEITDFEQKNNVHFDLIGLAVGSGGTHAGLVLGDRTRNFQGFAVGDSAEYFINEIYNIASHIDSTIPKDCIKVNDQYIGEGYGIASKEVLAFIKKIASMEGIVVDPVYTGKAFFGLVSEIKKGSYSDCENILFIHTGGIYGAFAQADLFDL